LPITCFQQESCLPITERVLVKDTVTKEAQIQEKYTLWTKSKNFEAQIWVFEPKIISF